MLVTADCCPFTVPVARAWQKAARGAEVPLRVLDAESDEGERFMDAAEVAGVPCAVAGPGRLLYGYPPPSVEARRFFIDERAR